MNDEFMLGVQLMLVGMSTVFLILCIVILLGKLLIAATNKLPAEEEQKKSPVAAAPSAIDAQTKAIIDATVAQLTGGKGHVSKVEKI